MSKKILSLVLAVAMLLTMAVPAFAADGDPTWSVEFDKSAKAAVVTVNGATEKFTNWKNNQAEEYTVNGWIISVTVKGNAIDKKALIGPVAAPVEPPADTTAAVTGTSSNSQIVVNAETRIWQDGFGFHCSYSGGNGATSVINLRTGATVKKGEQKDVFGTKNFPITLVRVGNTTLWNLQTEDIECATCGSKEWVTYSNNSGVINGKNIQAHHPAYAQIAKVWTDENPNGLEAIFDIYKYDSQKDDGKGELVVEGALPDVKYQLEPGTYVVSERVKEGYKVQDDVRLTVEEGKTTVFSFKNEPNDVEKFGALSIQKTVNGTPLDEWAAKYGYDISEIIKGMSFIAYLLDGENGNPMPGKVYLGNIDLFGVITFADPNISEEDDARFDLPVGWYKIEEKISGKAEEYFVGEGKTNVYYVGEIGVNAEDTSWVSGKKGVGTVVSHDGTGVNWKLPNVWNERLANEPYFQDLLDMGAKWIWDTEDTYQYGYTGDVVRFDYTIGLAADLTAPIIFAADNAAVIYVNGKLAAYTEVAFAGRDIPQTITDEDADTFFDSLDYGTFDGRWNEGWAHVYKNDIMLTAGENTITIFAANSESTNPEYTGNPLTGTDNDYYNLTNNPCGLIFGFDIPGSTFDNEALVVPYATVSFTKEASDRADVTQFAFDLFRFNAETDKYDIRIPYVELDENEEPIDGDGYYYADSMGTVSAEDLEVGKYVFKEVSDDYAPRGYEEGLYFEIVLDGTKAEVIWNISEGEGKDPDGNPIVVNEPILGALEVTANVTAQHEKITYEPVYEDLWKENKTDTLVSKKNHNLPSPNSGQVPVAVNITAASELNGVMYEVADSSPNNRGIGYFYNVRIVDGQIVITFPDVKNTDVGIMANDAGTFPNGQPNNKDGVQKVLTRENNTLSIALPADTNDDGFVFLYLHIKGGIQWYTGEKKVVGYVEVDRETVADVYEGTLTVTLKDEESNVVDSQIIVNGESVTFEKLIPGNYTCILSGDGFEDIEEAVVIVAGETASVGFTATVVNANEEEGKVWEIGTIIPAPTASIVRVSNFFFDVAIPEIPLASAAFDRADNAVAGEEVATQEVADESNVDEGDAEDGDIDDSDDSEEAEEPEAE